MLRSRKRPFCYLFFEGCQSLYDNVVQIGILFNKLCHLSAADSKQVVQYHYLAITMGSSPAGQRRNSKTVGHFFGQFGGNALKDDGKGPRFF